MLDICAYLRRPSRGPLEKGNIEWTDLNGATFWRSAVPCSLLRQRALPRRSPQSRALPPAPPVPKALPKAWTKAPTIPLWPGEPPGGAGYKPQKLPANMNPTWIRNIARPELHVFRPSKPNGHALLVMPGGAYLFVSIGNEGVDVAKRMNALGITVFVLTYRLPNEGWTPRADVPLQDAQRAMRVIRAQAAKYRISPDTPERDRLLRRRKSRGLPCHATCREGLYRRGCGRQPERETLRSRLDLSRRHHGEAVDARPVAPHVAWRPSYRRRGRALVRPSGMSLPTRRRHSWPTPWTIPTYRSKTAFT